jgi:hypothetical protein
MNILILTAGLSLSIAGGFCIKKNQKKYGLICIISGIMLLLFYLIFLFLDARAEIPLQILHIVIVWTFVKRSTTSGGKYSISKEPTSNKQNNIFNWRLFGFLLVPIFFICILPARFIPVKLDHENISMGGFYGGKYKISEIKSVDTVGFYPSSNFRIFGNGSFGYKKGDYKVRDEKKPVKLNIKRDTPPPYISIRMKDNRLFVFNFKEPEKTVEFYNQIINELNGN